MTFDNCGEAYVKSSKCSAGQCVEVAPYRKSSQCSAGDCVEVAPYRKSSHSAANGACVEVADYHKSSHSANGGGGCVEVADIPDGVFVRDSKHPDQPPLAFTRDEWAAFLHGVDNGEFV